MGRILKKICLEYLDNNAKFVAAKKLKLQQFLRSGLNDNYKQKMFLKLALESGYEAVEAFNSVDMDDKAMNNDMRKKLDEIRKQYGMKE